MIGRDLFRAKDLLRNNELVAIPTETVYGLAANALSDEAVIKIFEAKDRPRFNPLIVHGHSISQLSSFVKKFGPKARLLAEKFWPGPLTLLLDKNERISDLVTAGSNKVAIRIPAHQQTLRLLEMLDFPLVAPSANKYQHLSPTEPQHVQDQLSGKVNYIIHGGKTTVGLESTIVGFTEKNQPIIYRYGGISKEQIELVLKETVLINQSEETVSPGMQKIHYAPKIPLFLGDIETNLKLNSKLKVGVLSFEKVYDGVNIVANEVMAPNGNIHVAGVNLFSCLAKLQQLEIDVILAERVPQENIGIAINDRLEKAAAKYAS